MEQRRRQDGQCRPHDEEDAQSVGQQPSQR